MVYKMTKTDKKFNEHGFEKVNENVFVRELDHDTQIIEVGKTMVNIELVHGRESQNIYLGLDDLKLIIQKMSEIA